MNITDEQIIALAQEAGLPPGPDGSIAAHKHFARAVLALAAPVYCTDKMCACRGGPCVTCPDGAREKELAELRDSLAFYKRRAEGLQQAQKRMRDPERTMVCDILANGGLLTPEGERYTAPAPVAQEYDRPAAMDAFEAWADATAPDSKSTSLEKAQLAHEAARLMGVGPAPVAQGEHRLPQDMRDAFSRIEDEVAAGKIDAMATLARMRTAAQAFALAPVERPLTDSQFWQMRESQGWYPGDHYRIRELSRAIERAHGIGEEGGAA